MTTNRMIGLVVMAALGMAAGPQMTFALHACQDSTLTTMAADGSAAFSLRASLGFLEGKAAELVYVPEEGDHKLSELKWDLSGLVMGGVVFSGISHRFGINAGLWVPLNKGDGEMKDYDWFVPGLDWTDYSRSEVDVEDSYVLDANVTYLVYQAPRLRLRAVAGFKRDSWEWSDRGQEFIYSEDGFRDYRGHFGGQNVIDYQQIFDIPYLGLNLDGNTDKLEWSAYLLVSPAVTAEDYDHHILRETHFDGSFEGGTYLGLGCRAAYPLHARWTVSGSFQYQVIPEFRGDMVIREEDLLLVDSAAVSHESVLLSVEISRRF